MLLRKGSLVLVAAVLVCARTAAAQAPRLSVDGAIMVGHDARQGYPRTVHGGSVIVTHGISPRVSVGVEADVPRTRTIERSGVARHTDGTAIRYFVRDTFRGPTVAAIVAIRLMPQSPIDVAFVTGLGIEYKSYTQFATDDTIDASGVVTAHHEYDNSPRKPYEYTQTPLGIDAAIPIGRHLAIVPQFRFYFDPFGPLAECGCDGVHTRARLAIRVMF